jgi:hypothetical protein
MTLAELRKLAGIKTSLGAETSQHASELHKIEREKNIRPGTEEWFKLWFARPFLTHEMPTGFRGRKR